MRSLSTWLFISIISLGALLRFAFIGEIPGGLNFKEATLGFRAQNLINLGKDENGRANPFFFYNFEDIELPLPSYLVLPFVLVDQVNIALIRLPFALAGFFTVVGSILLTKKLFPKEQNLSLIVGFLIAVNPWSLWLSRFANYEILGLCFFIWGYYFFLSESRKSYFTSLSLFTMAILSGKIWLFFALIFSLFLLVQKRRKIWPVTIISIIVLVLILINPAGLRSFLDNDFSLLTDKSWLSNVDSLRGQNISKHLSILGQLFFNKTYYLVKILENFYSYINLSNLFARGDGISSHNPSNFGPVLFIFAPFFIWGIVEILRDKTKLFIFLWFIISTLPAIFYKDNFQINRFLLAILPISIIIGFGLNKLRFKPLLIGTYLISLYLLGVVIFDVLQKEPARSEDIWHKNTLSLARYLKENREGNVWITDKVDNNPGPAIGYVLNDPALKTNLTPQNAYKGWISSIGNIRIGDLEKNKEATKFFETYITSENEAKGLNCLSQAGTIESLGKKYLILKNCK